MRITAVLSAAALLLTGFSAANNIYAETLLTEAGEPHMTLTKTVTSEPENGTSYALGETITYQITLTNDGEVPIREASVTDRLTGDHWSVEILSPDSDESEGSADPVMPLVPAVEEDAALLPGEAASFTTSYIVTEEDLIAGSVSNTAEAAGKTNDPENPDISADPATVSSPTEECRAHLILEKTVVSDPADGEAYTAGETIEYFITAVNDGNRTLNNIVITDEKTEDVWEIASLSPGEMNEFATNYTVTGEDEAAGAVVNEITAAAEGPDGEEIAAEPAAVSVMTKNTSQNEEEPLPEEPVWEEPAAEETVTEEPEQKTPAPETPAPKTPAPKTPAPTTPAPKTSAPKPAEPKDTKTPEKAAVEEITATPAPTVLPPAEEPEPGARKIGPVIGILGLAALCLILFFLKKRKKK